MWNARVKLMVGVFRGPVYLFPTENIYFGYALR